jgi:hypothetical protein
MKPEYHEGKEAFAKFEKTMTTLFSAPKTVVKEKPTIGSKREKPAPVR